MPTPPPLAETVAAFDRRSGSYDDSHMHREVARHVAEALRPQAGDVLVDVAGGTGLTARAAITALGPAGTAVVVDASPGMLAAAGRAEPRLRRVRGDAHRLPLATGSADLVAVVTALHLLDQEAALREAVRVCRPGGRVAFTTWAADGWTISRLLRQAAWEEDWPLPDPNATTGTRGAAEALARRAGLHEPVTTVVRTCTPMRPEDLRWEQVAPEAPEPVLQRIRARLELAVSRTAELQHDLLLVVGTA